MLPSRCTHDANFANAPENTVKDADNRLDLLRKFLSTDALQRDGRGDGGVTGHGAMDS